MHDERASLQGICVPACRRALVRSGAGKRGLRYFNLIRSDCYRSVPVATPVALFHHYMNGVLEVELKRHKLYCTTSIVVQAFSVVWLLTN